MHKTKVSHRIQILLMSQVLVEHFFPSTYTQNKHSNVNKYTLHTQCTLYTDFLLPFSFSSKPEIMLCKHLHLVLRSLMDGSIVFYTNLVIRHLPKHRRHCADVLPPQLPVLLICSVDKKGRINAKPWKRKSDHKLPSRLPPVLIKPYVVL